MRRPFTNFAIGCAVVTVLASLVPLDGVACGYSWQPAPPRPEREATEIQDATAANSYRESGSTLLERARKLAQTSSLDEAEQTIRRYLAHDETSAEGHFLLGYILFKAAKPKDSLQEYTTGAKYQGPGAADLKIVALDYVLIEDYADAERWLRESVARNPKDVESWYYLGRAQYNENHFAEAVESFEHCLGLDSRHVKAEANLGLALEGLHRTDDATAAYRTAISWEEQGATKSAEPYIDLGTLLLVQNQNEQAVTYLLRATELAPEEVRARERLGTAYFRLNELSNAQIQLEKAVALAPTNAAIHYILGQAYRKEGLIDKARAEFARATELNGTHSSPASVAPEIAKP
jgi:Flp pilus assembly protein TadD